MSEPFEREIAVFSAARRLPAEGRAAYLEQTCAGDAALRQRVEALLQASEEAGPFLHEPAPGAQRPVDALSLPETVHYAKAPGEKAGDRIGQYKLLQQIGEGGCGVVFMAEQEQPVRRRVAIKVIKLGMDTNQVVARFEAERQALALMDHPNIAKVLDAGATDTGRPYFVMELVRGIKITDYCDQNHLSTEDRLNLFTQVCHAIQHAHQKGIIHRDIKPSNILVTISEPGAPGCPKVIDFGIAKATTGQRLTDKTVFTAFEQFIGTPAYMSPEQAMLTSLDIDTRTDIYALGVLLYELLTGQTPFDAKELMDAGLDAMRRIIREQEPVRPSTRLNTLLAADLTTVARHRHAEPARLGTLLRGDLDWIVMKALEKDRTRRYETANGLAADLKRYLTNEPVLARPPSAAYKIQKAWRRNKLAFTAAAVMTAALVVGVTVSTWQAIEASRARNAEKEQRLTAQAAQGKAEAAQQAEKQERLRAEAERAEARRLLYVANLNVAQQAWEQNNIGRLRQLLEETKASPYRGFEWYYWQRQIHLPLKELRGHLESVTAVAFSPDGRLIVTGSEDHTAKVWQASNGRELFTLRGHTYFLRSVAFSPDGQRIATGSWDGTAKVWEVASGHELLTLKGHNSALESVAFSPDGKRIVTASEDRTAKVWEATSGRELFTFEGHKDQVFTAAFSPDGQRIVTGSGELAAKVWDAASGRELLTLTGHSDRILSAAFSPDGQRIATCGFDRTAKVWEAASGRELLTLRGHSANVNSVAFSPDSKRIVTGSLDQTARVWDSNSGVELLTLKGHTAGINSVAFSPDGQRIVTGSQDLTAKIWVADGGRELLTFNGHSEQVLSAAFSPDSQRIATGSLDNTAKVWETASGQELRTLKGHSQRISALAFSPDGQRIATGSWDQTAKVWEAASGRELFTLQGHNSQIVSVAFSPDNQRIITGSWDQTAKVWEAASSREVLTLKGTGNWISSVAAFSPDGLRIVTGSGDGTAKVWDATSGRELLTLKGHSAYVSSVAFSPDGQRIVTGDFDRTAKVWEAAGGRELLTLKGHSAGIESVAFSPDGQRIVTGSDDHTAKVWEAASGRELLTLKGHGRFISCVAFSPDGQRIVTGSGDQTAKVWEAARAEQVAAWDDEERRAELHLASLQRERNPELERQEGARALDALQRMAHARDEGAIKRWLILAPIPLGPLQSGAEGLDVEQIDGEARLRPAAGETRAISGGQLKWKEVVLDDYVIDFNAILGHETTQSVAYALCYIRSEAPRSDLHMIVGSDDQAKVYLNGNQIYKCVSARPFFADQDWMTQVALNAGLNVLVFKVVNETLDWRGSIRFADAQGAPVKGIKVTLDPEAKDSR